ncbi:chromosome segregation protein ScpA [candidate division KSB1 bacterium]|nr:MAG: chromosome segregation protein ScpA [candidate division KSB1 bacterium]
MSYQLKLNVFEGPMDLLLFLIKKEEIDIYDIPISKIVKEYLEYLEFMRNLNLEVAGEFIYMAATLMKIKAQMLLPVVVGEDEEYEDPREKLIANLIEYQKFKEASRKLRQLENERRKLFTHISEEVDEKNEIGDMTYKKATLFDLIRIFNQIMTKNKETVMYYVEREELTMEDQIKFILNKFEGIEKISFRNLISELRDRLKKILTFLAILELAKQRIISIFQEEPYKDIWIFRGKKILQDQV